MKLINVINVVELPVYGIDKKTPKITVKK